MPRPLAYEPIYGQKYQLLLWDPRNRSFDHLDYAADNAERDHLVREYKLISSETIRVIPLPKKYHPLKGAK